MAEFKDAVRSVTTTQGTGTIDLNSNPIAGYQPITVHSPGATVQYRIESADRTEWENGEGVLNAGRTTMTRPSGSVSASSNSGTLVNFGAGTKIVETTINASGLIPIGDNQIVSSQRTASIYAVDKADGTEIVADTGILKTIINSASVSIAGGKLVCTDAIDAVYLVLDAVDDVQYMRAVVQFEADCKGVLALAIPFDEGTFPGVGGTGAADAGVHAIFTTWSGTAVIKNISCAGYGTNAGVITGMSVDSPLAFVGYTREIELHYNKTTGRVTIMVDGTIVIDYCDPRTKSYVGRYGIFEFFGAATKKPKFLSVECGVELKVLVKDNIASLHDIYYATATAISGSWNCLCSRVTRTRWADLIFLNYRKFNSRYP